MIDPLILERGHLRKKLLAQREGVSPQKRHLASEQIIARLATLPVLQTSWVVFTYCHYRCEVETDHLIELCLQRGKQVCVPVSHPDKEHMQAIALIDPVVDLVPGFKNIPEPQPELVKERQVSPKTIGVAIVPGVVFGRCGHRLGYGGGFYDRFLAQAAPQALRIGLAFSFQLIDRIPSQPHDIPMDMVITEREILTWPRGGHAPDRCL